jgi:uncharacterized spore protein YtfJ
MGAMAMVSQMVDGNAAILDVVRRLVDGASVHSVFGEPVTQDGVTVIPVARVGGAGGSGGGGSGPAGGDSAGTGGGYLLRARPAGVFVVRNGRVSWRPAVDVNRLVLGGQLVALAAALAVRAFIRSRGR